ncbi:MAG: hypothetical protein QW594_02420, partial [Candidatus Woesearchaeota archaeon]
QATITTDCEETEILWLNSSSFLSGKGQHLVKRNLTQHTNPGNNTLLVKGCNVEQSYPFVVLPIMAIETITPKHTCNINKMQQYCTITHTIKNIGNTALEVFVVPPSNTSVLLFDGKPITQKKQVETRWQKNEILAIPLGINGTGLKYGNYTFYVRLEIRQGNNEK